MRLGSKKTVLNFAVAVVILGVFLHVVGIGEILGAIRGASLFFVVLGFAAGVGMVLVAGVAWKVAMTVAGYDFGWGKMFRLFFAANFLNSITPLGQAGGEPFMAYILSKDSDTAYERAFATVFSFDLVRSTSFFTFTVAGLVFFVFFQPSNPVVSLLALVVLGVAVAILVLMYLVWQEKEMAEKVVLRIGMVLKRLRMRFLGKKPWHDRVLNPERLVGRIDNFYDTLHSVFGGRDMIDIVVVSHVSWWLGIVSMYGFLLALGWKTSLGLLLLAYPAAALATFLPLPGGLGGVEVALTGLLVFVASVPVTVASAAVILHRVSTYVFILAVGGGCMAGMADVLAED